MQRSPCWRLVWRSASARRATNFSRSYSTKIEHGPSKTRNIAIVAHIDSGKTTLTESILLKSSYLSSAGTVDTGSTTTDFLPAERERGITIQSASIPVKWKDWTYYLIDTPGHADFGMEVESASRVVDGAVVLIDSVEGVEAQTKGVWNQLDRYGVPTRMMFLNKLDRPGASFRSSLLSILAHRLHPNPVVLTLPIASFDPDDYTRAEPGIQGLVDLVKWEVWKWDEAGVSSRHPLPHQVDALAKTDILPPNHPIISHLVPARTALLENLAMFSDDLMEELLDLPSSSSSYLSVTPDTLLRHLRAASLKSDILPVLCGSATKHIGTELVLDYIGELLADPLSIPHEPQNHNSPVQLLAWKVTWDSRKGWMTFVRVYSGTLRKQSTLINSTRNERERVSKLLLLYASDTEEVDELPFGSVGVILGLKHTRTGDTLVGTQSGGKKSGDSSTLRNIVAPPAVMSTSVVPQTTSDLQPVQDALQALVRTDPSVRIDSQEGQLLVHGLGALHLEIVERRLRDEWDVNFEFGRRRVSYREGFGSGSSGMEQGTWTTDAGGRPTTMDVALDIRPLEEHEKGDGIWDGNLVLDKTGKALPAPEALPPQQQMLANVARGIANTLSTSPHTSLALSRLRIQIMDFALPPHAQPALLAGASAFILRERVRAAGLGPVMEPFIRLRIVVHEDSLGKVVKDLTECGGEVLDLTGSGSVSMDGQDDVASYSDDGIYIPPDWLSTSSASSPSAASAGSKVLFRRTIHAIAPLSKMLDYSNRLRALSGGHGQFEMSNAGFREVSDARKQEILQEIGRV